MARTGVTSTRQRIPDRRQHRPYEHGSRAVFYLLNQEAEGLRGAVSLPITFGFVIAGGTQAKVTAKGAVSLPVTFGRRVSWTVAPPSGVNDRLPDPVLSVGFQDQPLELDPDWAAVSDRLRGPETGLSVKRGRNYEFDRMETGTLSALLDNRDSALSPVNSASPYAPIRSTRPVKASLVWGISYPLFRGITEGFPQNYPSLGKDAVVSSQANDLFYALNNSRFIPGSTTLTAALTIITADGEETITVDSTALPLPQEAPFTISVAGLTSEWPVEEMEVLEILGIDEYRVRRTAAASVEHPVGAAVTTEAVRFGEELSGVRIQRVLEAVGFGSGWYDLDEGQSVIAPSVDLANVSPLEHINLVTEAEFGRFFVSRDGRFTFRDRHSGIVDHLTPVFTFRDGADTSAGEVPFTLSGSLEHSEEKLYNRIKITIEGGDYHGQVVDLSDAASIAEHFERVYERTLPYANLNDADSAARFLLARNSEATLRLPAINVQGIRDPGNLWPLLLAREIGDRVRFRYQPEGGGDEIDKDMLIEGISHSIAPDDHVVSFQCSEVDSVEYWILGMAGFTELNSTTRVGF